MKLFFIFIASITISQYSFAKTCEEAIADSVQSYTGNTASTTITPRFSLPDVTLQVGKENYSVSPTTVTTAEGKIALAFIGTARTATTSKGLVIGPNGDIIKANGSSCAATKDVDSRNAIIKEFLARIENDLRLFEMSTDKYLMATNDSPQDRKSFTIYTSNVRRDMDKVINACKTFRAAGKSTGGK